MKKRKVNDRVSCSFWYDKNINKMVKFKPNKFQALILIFCFLAASCSAAPNLVSEPGPSSIPLKSEGSLQQTGPSTAVQASQLPEQVKNSAVPAPLSTSFPVEQFKPLPGASPAPSTAATAGPVKSGKILFDTSRSPFGNVGNRDISSLSKLRDYLVSVKFSPLFENFAARQSLDDIDTIIIPCPSLDYSQPELDKLTAFVRSGKKVVILAEWGGFAGFSATSLNIFLRQANLKINEDVIKESESRNYALNDEQLLVSGLVNHPVTADLKRIAAYSSASVITSAGNITPFDASKTRIVASTSHSSFRIQEFSKGTAGIVAVSAIGTGKIVVIGDASLFSNADTNNNGKINLEEENNKQLILNILNW